MTPREQRGGYVVESKAARALREDIDRLLTALTPEVHDAVSTHLQEPAQKDAMLLDAWERAGRRDRGRTPSLSIKCAKQGAFTALGIACLVRYASGWLDEELTISVAQGALVSKTVACPPRNDPAGP